MSSFVPQKLFGPKIPGPNREAYRASAASRLQFATLVLGALTTAMGCSVATAESEEASSESTHTFVKIQHVASDDGETRGDALAGFLRIPADADPAPLLELAGLDRSVPDIGTCSTTDGATDWDGLPLSEGELLEANRVELRTEKGEHDLAPHAFPEVADLLHGVVYASRDRSGAELPAGATYRISGESVGIESQQGLDGRITGSQTGPELPSQVQVGGTPFHEIETIRPAEVLDFTWARSECDPLASCSEDLVVVSVLSDELEWTCTFKDSEEFGSVPLVTAEGTSLGAEGQSAIVSVHRVRTSEETAASGNVSLSFDFAIEGDWQFSGSVPPDDVESDAIR